MNSMNSDLQVFSSGLTFQNRARFAALLVAMALLAITLSVKVGYADPLSRLAAEASAAVCPADMVAYWKLDETGGTTFTDSVGTNHASCTGDACPLNFPGGIVNSALDFEAVGVTGDEVNVPDQGSMNWSATDSFSVEAWVNTTQNCTGNRVFVGKHSSTASWWLGCTSGSGLVAFSLRDNSTNSYQLNTAVPINDGNWHHLVGIRDGVNNLNTVYVDGVLAASQTPPTPYAGTFANSQPLTMGYHNSSDPDFHFDGALDEVAIYSRVLTPAEIETHYNGGTGVAYCDALVAPTISPIPDQSAVVGQLFTYNVDAIGSPEPTFNLLAPEPAGMTIDAASGVISWTPGATGTFAVTVRASNSEGFSDESFDITVSPAPIAPAIDPISNQDALLGTLFTYTATATGSPSPAFTLAAAPAGMTIHPTTGVISWTPEEIGIFNVTVRATNSAGSADASFTVTVSGVAPAIDPIPNQSASAGTPFTYDVNATGNPAPTFSLVAPAPAGMTINAATGVISWTPATAGTFNVTVRATNSQGFADASFTVTVAGVAPVINPISNKSAAVGTPFTYDVNATGNPAPTFSLTQKPGGMTINANTGVIKWTPGATGTFNVTVRATNSEGFDDESFTITVTEALHIFLPVVISN